MHRGAWIPIVGVVGMIAVLIGVGRVTKREAPANGESPIRALAVLPLEDFSPEPRQPYLGEGLTEALIGELSIVHGLDVISRTSVMQFLGDPTSAERGRRGRRIRAVFG
jgi:TolB-like protein